MSEDHKATKIGERSRHIDADISFLSLFGMGRQYHRNIAATALTFCTVLSQTKSNCWISKTQEDSILVSTKSKRVPFVFSSKPILKQTEVVSILSMLPRQYIQHSTFSPIVEGICQDFQRFCRWPPSLVCVLGIQRKKQRLELLSKLQFPFSVLTVFTSVQSKSILGPCHRKTIMNTIIHSRQFFLVLLLVWLGGSFCESLSLQSSTKSLLSSRPIPLSSQFQNMALPISITSHATTGRRCRGHGCGLAATASEDEAASSEEKKDEAAATPDKTVSESKDDDKKTSSAKTVLLTIPLFIKFCIVLVIKAVTDLLVFPVLLLWRFATRVKRRTLGLFRRGGSNKTNGEAASQCSSSVSAYAKLVAIYNNYTSQRDHYIHIIPVLVNLYGGDDSSMHVLRLVVHTPLPR